MTAVQILEKLGADASFNSDDLDDKDRVSIEQAVNTSKPFSVIQVHLPPEEDEDPDEDSDEES